MNLKQGDKVRFKESPKKGIFTISKHKLRESDYIDGIKQQPTNRYRIINSYNEISQFYAYESDLELVKAGEVK